MNGAEPGMRDHRQVWDLIPWVVNGTASEEQRRAVLAHARQCDDCGRELQFQQSLQSALAEPPVPRLDPADSFARIESRLAEPAGTQVRDAAATTRSLRRRPGGTGRWHLGARALLAAVVVEAVALAALGNAWWLQMRSQTAGAPYQVLSAVSASMPAATIRVVLAPDITAAQLQGLLLNANLQIVAGPSEAGVYSLAPRAADDPATRRTSLALLRASPQVRFAEPVTDSAVPR